MLNLFLVGALEVKNEVLVEQVATLTAQLEGFVAENQQLGALRLEQ